MYRSSKPKEKSEIIVKPCDAAKKTQLCTLVGSSLRIANDTNKCIKLKFPGHNLQIARRCDYGLGWMYDAAGSNILGSKKGGDLSL